MSAGRGMSAVKCRQDEEVRRPDSFGNDSVFDILQKMSSNRAESCEEEVPTGRSTNLQSINRRPSSLKTVEADGSEEVPTGRSTNLQSINRRPSALKTVEADGSKQIELFLCQELEEKETMPDILGCCGAGGSDAVVLENVSTRANPVESGTPCSGGNDAVVGILLNLQDGVVYILELCSRADRAEQIIQCRSAENDAVVNILQKLHEGVVDILEKLRSRADWAEQIIQCRSAEQTVEDDGSKQVGSSAEQTVEDDGSKQVGSSAEQTVEDDGSKQQEQKVEDDGTKQVGSSAEQTVEDDGSKQVGSFTEQTIDDSSLFPGSTRFVPGIPRFHLKGYNKFNGKKPGLDNGYVPGTCEKKPVASHCTCLQKKHEASSSYSSGIEHHMSPIPEGFPTKQDKKTGRVESWAILQFADISALQSIRFSCEVRDACAEIHMDIEEMPLSNIYLDCALPDGIEDSLWDEYKFINTGVPRGKQLGLLIIILPEVRDFDEKVEAVCKVLGVVYHCCFPQDVVKLNKQYLNNIACEINAKVLKRNSCCDYCKNIGLDGSSMEFCVLDEEFDDHVSDSDEDMSFGTDPDEVYGSENVFLMEGDDGSEQVDEGAVVTLDIPDTLVMNGNSLEYHTLEESGEPLPESPESCSERTDLDLVEVEQGITMHWACISYSIIDHNDLFRFFSKLHAVSMANGMHFNSMPIKIELVGSSITAGTLSQTWSDLCNSATKVFTRNGIKGAQIEFILVILPECRDFDEEIEKIFNDLGVVYQFCLPLTVRIPNSQHLKKFARQIKFKVSKRGIVVPFVSEAPTILLGADITHCAPEEGSRSVASVVASFDWPKVSKYGALVASQPHHEVIIRDLFNEYGGMVSNLILSFNRRTEEIPQRMIFFRHGIIEGQQSHICQQEIHAIRQDCALLGYVPKLTYVVVTQRLKMEFEGSSNMTKKRLRVHQDTS